MFPSASPIVQLHIGSSVGQHVIHSVLSCVQLSNFWMMILWVSVSLYADISIKAAPVIIPLR